jgi:hypothetical protein
MTTAGRQRPGDPLTSARSPWIDEGPWDMPGAPGRQYRRNVHDGFLTALVSTEPHGQHLSVAWHPPGGIGGTHRAERKRALRYPTWDEIAHARYELCPRDIDMVIILPAEDDYLAFHPTTFHLHQVDNLPASATDRAR